MDMILQIWLINIECGSTNANRCSLAPEEYIKNTYPAIYEHFIDIANRPTRGKGLKGRDDMGDYWWELRSCAYTNDFSKQKIAYREISDEMGACLIDDEYFLNNKCYIITGNIDLKPLVAYLNSNLFTQIVLQMVNTTGGKGADFIDKLHAPNLTANQVNKLGTLVEQIQVCQSNVLDEQIDQIIYEAFNLSLDEIDFLNKRKRSQ